MQEVHSMLRSTCTYRRMSRLPGCSRSRPSVAIPRAASDKAPLVKICGVTNPEDASFAAKQGADLIGMIMWPKAKRSVDDSTAAAIATAAHENGAKAVGVFVDEDAEKIAARCSMAQLDFAQLHGDGARKALCSLPEDLAVIYVMHANAEGSVQTSTPSELAQQLGSPPRKVDFLIIDGMQGGSGERFEWDSLEVPVQEAKRGWLLAGGLDSEIVATAIGIAAPTGVDISSGVCGPDGLLKDHKSVQAFVENAKAAMAV